MPGTRRWYNMGSGQAPSGVGPIAELGPGGSQAGRIVGMRPALKTIGLIGGMGGALLHSRELARQAGGKEFDDSPGGTIPGSDRGRVIKDEPFSSNEEEDDAFAHAKQAGKENRNYYRRKVGTPKRRPFGGFGDPDDESDLRRGTP